MPIHVLDQDTINKIAAGEVIERPMAVVKELVENAIDARANSVTVEIKDGGKALIRITDNGCGIVKDEIDLAFTPHATSKIHDAQDLLSISTLGFRGEALASIASVSQLEMVTKTRDTLMGYRYQIDGGQAKDIEEIGCPDGTTFLVRNLFYNTPARLKFLKTSQTEAGYIGGVIERMALSHPDVSFRFINQNQPKLHTSGNGNLKDVIYNIYGRDITSNLLVVDSDRPECTIQGFIGKPVISRGNRSYINYFINGRYIKSAVVHRAIEEAYAPYSMQHRYPFTVLHLTVDPKYIDVNVHPQKMEIRFTNERELYDVIYKTISDTLSRREFIPDVSFGKDEKLENKPKNKLENKPEIKHAQEPEVQSEQTKRVPNVGQVMLKKPSPEDRARLMRQMSEREVKSEEPKKNQQVECKTEITADAKPEMKAKEIHEQVKPNADSIKYVKEFHEQATYNVKQETLFESGILKEEAHKDIKIIGQVFSTYWILQYDDNMYMVDQHAAHEKVLYERFMKQINNHNVTMQMVKPPIVLTLSMIEQQAVEDNMDMFNSLGYNIEAFGGSEYMVSGVPAYLPDIATEPLLMEVINNLVEDKGSKTPELLLERIASMSCKAAVKGNNNLPAQQARELITELMTLDNPYNCPHGRPTMIKMSKKDLEKKFKRIV